jgi:hypothetical protein
MKNWVQDKYYRVSKCKRSKHQFRKGKWKGQVVVNLLGDNSSKDNSNGVYINGTIRDMSLTGSMKGKTLTDLVSAINSGNT